MKADRINRVNSLVKQTLAQVIMEEFDWARSALLSVMRVDTAPDLSHSKIYVTAYGDKEKQEEAFRLLKKSKGYLRLELGQRVRLRKIPELRFIFDDSVERAERVIGKIQKLEVTS